MTPDNEFANRLFAAFASASVLKAEHRAYSAKLRALAIESEHIRAELRESKPAMLEAARSRNLNNRLHRARLPNG